LRGGKAFWLRDAFFWNFWNWWAFRLRNAFEISDFRFRNAFWRRYFSGRWAFRLRYTLEFW